MDVLTRSWKWRFGRTPAEVWPLLADTVRLNEAAGLGKYTVDEVAQPDGSVRYLARMKKGPFVIRWEEVPVEWIAGRRFVHRRAFFNGPFRAVMATLTLAAENGGTLATFHVEIEPRRGFGLVLRSVGVMSIVGRVFEPLVRNVAAYLDGAAERPFESPQPRPDPALDQRVEEMVQRIEETPYGHGLARRLAAHLLTAQESELFRIRPRALARAWEADERAVIECCLQAVREGMLFLRWDLLCPNCEGAKSTVEALDRLPTGAHCDTCNIDYGRDFTRNVELTFHPAPTVRDVVDGAYCFFAPMTTPHIKVQQTLEPGERRELDADLPLALYRVRTLHPGPAAPLDWTGGGFPEVIVGPEDIDFGVPAAPGRMVLTNRAGRRRTCVVEAPEWARDAVTAHRITSMQAFRDLFSDQALRPGDEVAIRNVALMFTDLSGSTAMYGRIGDATAYGLVRDHFAVLTRTVRERNGTVVKTIGDAVMAAFADPVDAVAAAIDVQRAVAALREPGGGALVLKIGIHAGPCIAVTLNDRLDYFGSTVNKAARLEGESTGGDVVLSAEICADPAVADYLRAVATTADKAAIKGFDAPVEFRRIAADSMRKEAS